jgi:hypothetical protein
MEEKIESQRKKLINAMKESTKSVRMMLIGFIFSSAIIKFLLGMPFSYNVFLALIIWLLASFPFFRISEKTKTISRINNIHFLWIIFELLLLTIIIYYIGGITWIGPILYVFFPVYETFLFGNKQKIAMITLTIAFLVGLGSLQYLEIINPHIIFPGINIYEGNYFYITLLLEIGIIIFTTVASSMFRKEFEDKIKELNLTYKEKERTRDNLKKKEKELNKRVKELEKFYRLTVGRENKMIELKKEIKELKKRLVSE